MSARISALSSKFLALIFLFLTLATSYLLLATPILAADISPEERAVYNLNQNLLTPEAIKDKPTEQNFFLQVASIMTTFFKNIFDPQKFVTQSESIHQVQVPNEANPNSKSKSTDIFENFLGGKTGVYSVSLPEGVGKADDKIIDKEMEFQQANFPEGIKPVIGQTVDK